MINFKKVPIVIFVLFFLLSYNVKALDKALEFEIGKEFNVAKLKLNEGTVIIDYCKEDVNGDNIKDNILLTGTKAKVYADMKENIKIILQDGKSKKYYKVSLGKIEFGYNGKIFLGDFSGDKVLDIFVSTYNGGKGGTSSYSVISFRDNKAAYLFQQEQFSRGLSFNVNYDNNFMVRLYNKELIKCYSLDVSSKKSTYIAEGIYNKKGKLLKNQEGESEALNELTPIDMDKDGVYELKAIQRLRGICSSDTLGYVKAVWKYDENVMNLCSLEILPYAKTGQMKRTRSVVPVGKFN